MRKEGSDSLSVINKNRLEFLFDGIFAISMTILVLELKVPELVDKHSIAELAYALAHHVYTFVSYLLTFMMLGLFWYRHNSQYHHFQMITKSMFVFHLIQLAATAFFPFCAALFGRYPTNSLSVTVYSGCIMVFIWAMFANWIVAKRSKAFKKELTLADYLMVRNRQFRGCIIISTVFIIALIRIFFIF
jgi:uncharacterized membrane protein